jgi:hypothetical protein
VTTESTHCLNCGAAVTYHYCAVCGQETKLHVPSAGEFIHEFVGHYVALEGKLWNTLQKLLCRPGFLTAEYIAGRRVRYVQPLRVYLTFSIIFFFVLKLAGTPVGRVEEETNPPSPKENAELVKGAVQLPGASIMPEVQYTVANKVNAFFARPPAEQTRLLTSAFFAYVPYAMFLLMPVFALYLKLLYLGTGRRYGEHFLFALHANAFAFAMFSAILLANLANINLLIAALVLYLIAYLPLAMRSVYGGSRWATGLRWMMLSMFHVLSIGIAIACAYSIVVLA